MSTPDQPDTPPLTRRQMRDLRSTGATPVVPPAEEPAAEPPAPVVAPLPRAAEPAPVAPAPAADAQVDLGVSPLTRRQAREQERIRTASVPVVTPDPTPVVAPPVAEPEPARKGKREKRGKKDRGRAAEETAPPVISAVPAASEPETAPEADDAPEQVEDHTTVLPKVIDETPAAAVADEPVGDETVVDVAETEDAGAEPVDAAEELVEDATEADDAVAASVNPALGSELLAGATPVATLPPSFDQLLTRSSVATGAISTPNALILSQTPSAAPLVAPITATGEVLITGTFELPEGLGSVGHLPGTADGKDLDVALIDGELPAASSPTPIAASAAISTVRNSGEEIIRPPAPEKGGRLMLTLVITAGALALALAGVLILAITTGVF